MRRVLLLVAAAALTACATSIPDPAVDVSRKDSPQTAVFAGGCFWCTEAVFEQLAGVKDVVSGYAGGTKETAQYELVSSGKTGHAESIRVTFDPGKITYGQLLKVFFATAHDPTTLNRQGPDWGKQYRSEIFYTDPEQKRVAEAYIQQLNQADAFKKPIVTLVAPLEGFYPAEEYHQNFVRQNPTHPYVMANAVPKIQKTRKEFASLVKSK